MNLRTDGAPMQRSAADSVAGAGLTGALGESPSARARTPPPLARSRVFTRVRPAIRARHDSPPDDSGAAARASGRGPDPDVYPRPELKRGRRGARSALARLRPASMALERPGPYRCGLYRAIPRRLAVYPGGASRGTALTCRIEARIPASAGAGDRNIPQGVRPLSDYPGQDS